MLDDRQKTEIENKLTAWADQRVPIHVRDKVVLQFRFENQSVVLFEKRPYFRDPSKWTESPFAKIRFAKSKREWTLYCMGGNGKWRKYEPFPKSTSFDALLAEINEDPTCIFWG